MTLMSWILDHGLQLHRTLAQWHCVKDNCLQTEMFCVRCYQSRHDIYDGYSQTYTPEHCLVPACDLRRHSTLELRDAYLRNVDRV